LAGISVLFVLACFLFSMVGVVMLIASNFKRKRYGFSKRIPADDMTWQARKECRSFSKIHAKY